MYNVPSLKEVFAKQNLGEYHKARARYDLLSAVGNASSFWNIKSHYGQNYLSVYVFWLMKYITECCLIA